MKVVLLLLVLAPLAQAQEFRVAEPSPRPWADETVGDQKPMKLSAVQKVRIGDVQPTTLVRTSGYHGGVSTLMVARTVCEFKAIVEMINSGYRKYSFGEYDPSQIYFFAFAGPSNNYFVKIAPTGLYTAIRDDGKRVVMLDVDLDIPQASVLCPNEVSQWSYMRVPKKRLMREALDKYEWWANFRITYKGDTHEHEVQESQPWDHAENIAYQDRLLRDEPLEK